MESFFVQSIVLILTIAVANFITRLFPFVLWGRNQKVPKFVRYLGLVLPPAIMGMLVIYGIKSINLKTFPYGLAEIIGLGSVVLLHKWKKNNLISIFGATIIYMFLLQVIF